MPLIDDLAQMVPVVDSRLAGGWSTEGITVNPGIGAVLADTGQLVAGYYDVRAMWTSTEAGTGALYLQHRNAANTADVKSQYSIFALSTFYAVEWLRNYRFETNERLRIVAVDAIAADVQASIIWSKRI